MKVRRTVISVGVAGMIFKEFMMWKTIYDRLIVSARKEIGIIL